MAMDVVTEAVVMALAHFSSHHAQSVAGFDVAAFAFGTVRIDGHEIAFAGSEEKIFFDSMLARVEIVVAAACSVEFGMRAAFDDLALLHDHDLVGAADGGKTVRDNEGGASLHEISETVLNHFFGFGIQTGRCLVENEDAR